MCGPLISIPASCFKSQALRPKLKFLRCFYSPCTKILGLYPKLYYYRIFPYPSHIFTPIACFHTEPIFPQPIAYILIYHSPIILIFDSTQLKSTTNVMVLRTKIQTFSRKQDVNIQMHIKADLDVWNSTMGMC
jgi:hypothetical protein